METLIFIAKIIGLIYTSFGVGLLLNRKYYKNELPKLLGNSAYLISGGFIAIIIGVLIIENHNYWEKSWIVIITLIGWMAVIKGIILIAFPTIVNIYKPILKNDLFFKILAPLVFIFGLTFFFIGFFSNY
jgi:hypothetical protein